MSRLPDSLDTVAARISGQEGSLTGWSKVCVVKGTFLKGRRSPTMNLLSTSNTLQALPKKRQALLLRL